MNGHEMRAALQALGWKQTDLSRKTGVHRNTVNGWAHDAPPQWVAEYLGALLGIKRLHDAHVAAPRKEGANIDDGELIEDGRAAQTLARFREMPPGE